MAAHERGDSSEKQTREAQQLCSPPGRNTVLIPDQLSRLWEVAAFQRTGTKDITRVRAAPNHRTLGQKECRDG